MAAERAAIAGVPVAAAALPVVPALGGPSARVGIFVAIRGTSVERGPGAPAVAGWFDAIAAAGSAAPAPTAPGCETARGALGSLAATICGAAPANDRNASAPTDTAGAGEPGAAAPGSSGPRVMPG